MLLSQERNELYKSTIFLPTLTKGTVICELSVQSKSKLSLAIFAAFISTLPFLILGKIFF